jgi:D-glycero-D-manno-heptose 1,7-bisphosphate phosphatase
MLTTRGCVFLDRDGVINERPSAASYIGSWEEIRLIPTIVDWIRLFNFLGYLVVVVTNQRGVALGLTSREAVETIHEKIIEHVAAQGARIDHVLYCPHEENTCNCRKPKPGLLLEAQARWGIDFSRSILIGDSDRDRALAQSVGLRFVLVDRGRIIETATDVKDKALHP